MGFYWRRFRWLIVQQYGYFLLLANVGKYFSTNYWTLTKRFPGNWKIFQPCSKFFYNHPHYYTLGRCIPLGGVYLKFFNYNFYLFKNFRHPCNIFNTSVTLFLLFYEFKNLCGISTHLFCVILTINIFFTFCKYWYIRFVWAHSQCNKSLFYYPSTGGHSPELFIV